MATSTLETSPSITAENNDFLRLQEELQTSMNRAILGSDPVSAALGAAVDVHEQSAKLWHDHITNRCFPLGPLA